MKIIRAKQKETIKKIFESLYPGFKEEGKFEKYDISYNVVDFTNAWINVGEEGCLLAAVDNDKVVGGIGGVISPSLFNSKLKIVEELFWYILPECRNKHIGQKLYTELEQWASSKEATHIVMVALSDLKSVKKFYNANKFNVLETTWIKKVN